MLANIPSHQYIVLLFFVLLNNVSINMKFNSLLFAEKADNEGNRRAPLIFIPTLYFAEGLPYVLVNLVSVPMYAKLGVSNELIGLYTSLFMWPWILKMFWGPVVDRYSTVRSWLLRMQLLCIILFFAIAIALGTIHYFLLSVIIFSLLAFVSATHDIVIDGFYMLTLTQKQQAFFVGIRSLFYKIAMIFGTGLLIYCVGLVENDFGIVTSWITGFSLCGIIFLCVYVFHVRYLPHPRSEMANGGAATPETYSSFLNYYHQIFKQFFTQKHIIPILAFIFLYRFGEAQLTKMVPPFLLNTSSDGGLGLSTEQYGIIQGLIGSTSLIIGGITGGWLIARYGLHKCIWPMAFALNVPNLVYVYLAFSQPSLLLIATAIAVEQFGYGAGFSSFMMFLIQISKGKYKTSLYAIASGVMAFGMMVPGVVSGYLQQWLGYNYFFIVATLLTIPGMVIIFFIPLNDSSASASQ